MFAHPPASPSLNPGTCLQHATNPVTSYCVRCGRPMCDLCTFWVGSAIFCPECLSAGASGDERSSVTIKGVLSLVLAMLTLFGMLGMFAAANGGGLTPFALTALEYAILGCGLGGLSLGLIGREGAARTGSLLPLVGAILNGVLVGVYTLLMVVNVVGMLRG